MELYTCDTGINRLNNGEYFWAWIEDELVQGGYKITVNESDLEIDDEGLYIVKELSSIKIIQTP